MKKFETIIAQMNEEMETLREKYKEKTQFIFKSMFSEFFSEHPEVTAFGWHQYTPYFNDGDECVFRCNVEYGWATNAPDYQNVSYGEYDGENEDWVWVDDPDYGCQNEELIPEKTSKSLEKLRKVLGGIDEEVYKTMFGDHVTVIVTPNGIETEYYEHD